MNEYRENAVFEDAGTDYAIGQAILAAGTELGERRVPGPVTKKRHSERGVAMVLSKHAEQRLRQRGYKSKDLELILRHGTATGDGTILRNKDVDEAIRERKKEITALERLRGTAVASDGRSIITIQRARRWKERSMIRRSELSGPRRRRAKQPLHCGAA